MCLVTLAWKCHPRWRLLMAGNRDEFHARPTAALHAWPDSPAAVIAGRDLRSGGSWMGINGNGHAAVVTNVRDPTAATGGPSRGELIAGYLEGNVGATAYTDALALRAAEFAPFNLLVADADHCAYLGNRPAAHRVLQPGIHGMSNGALDAPWPKTRRLMQVLDGWLESGEEALDVIWQALAGRGTAGHRRSTGTGADALQRVHPWP